MICYKNIIKILWMQLLTFNYQGNEFEIIICTSRILPIVGQGDDFQLLLLTPKFPISSSFAH